MLNAISKAAQEHTNLQNHPELRNEIILFSSSLLELTYTTY